MPIPSSSSPPPPPPLYTFIAPAASNDITGATDYANLSAAITACYVNGIAGDRFSFIVS